MEQADPRARSRRFAEQTLAALPAISPRNTQDAADLEEIRDLAERLYEETGRLPTVAFAGVLDAGKSLLLNQLCELPTMLAVSNAPAAATLTVLQVRPGAPGTPPAIRWAEMACPSRRQVADRAAQLVSALVLLVDSARQPYDVSKLRGWRPVDPARPRAIDWARVDDLATQCWATNPGMRHACFELMTFLNAVLAGWRLLAPEPPGGSPTTVTEADAGACVPLDPHLLQAAVATRPLHPPAQPPTRRTLPPVPVGAPLDATTLTAVLPLVSRVTLHLSLPVDRWPLPGAFRLIDIPGLDAGSVQDEILAEAHLRQASTIVTVLPAQRPRSEAVARLISMLDRDRKSRNGVRVSVLVAANRFDEMPMPAAVERGTADLLDPTNAPSFAELRQVTRNLTDSATSRPVLTSALAHAAQSGTAPWVEVDTDDLRRAVAGTRRWKQVARNVQAHNPQDELADALYAVSADAGIERLRTTIVEHMLGTGADVARTEIESRHRQLRQCLDRFVTRLTESGGSVPVEVDGVAGDEVMVLRDPLRTVC